MQTELPGTEIDFVRTHQKQSDMFSAYAEIAVRNLHNYYTEMLDTDLSGRSLKTW